MTTLRLRLVPLSAPGPKTMGLPALAWLEGDVIVVRRPFHRLFFSTGRLMHEVEHALAGLDNRMHEGHDWHFCVRSRHAFRVRPRACALFAAPWVADALRRDGAVAGLQGVA